MSKWKVTGTFWGKKNKSGKRTKNGVHLVNTEDGTKSTVLTPAGKGAKYAQELKDGKRMTNSGAPKMGENGKQLGLTKQQRAFRSGYLQARKDSANAYKANKNRGGN